MTYWSAAFRSPFFGPKPRGRDQSICNDRMCFKHSWNFLTFDANTWNLHLTDWTNVMWHANKCSFFPFPFFKEKKNAPENHCDPCSGRFHPPLCTNHLAQIQHSRKFLNLTRSSVPIATCHRAKKTKIPWSSMVSQNISKCNMSHPYINHHGAFVHPCLSCTKYKVMRQLQVWHIALGNRKMPHWSFPDS